MFKKQTNSKRIFAGCLLGFFLGASVFPNYISIESNAKAVSVTKAVAVITFASQSPIEEKEDKDAFSELGKDILSQDVGNGRFLVVSSHENLLLSFISSHGTNLQSVPLYIFNRTFLI